MCVEVDASWVNGLADVVFEVVATSAFSAIYADIVSAVGVDAHGWIEAGVVGEYVLWFAGEAVAVIRVVFVAVGGDLVADTVCWVEAGRAECAVGLIDCDIAVGDVVGVVAGCAVVNTGGVGEYEVVDALEAHGSVGEQTGGGLLTVGDGALAVEQVVALVAGLAEGVGGVVGFTERVDGGALP